MMGFCKITQAVIPAKAGIQSGITTSKAYTGMDSQLDSGLCRNDAEGKENEE
jgi:hypothetical protein